MAFLCAAVCVCVMVANTHKKALKKIQSTNSLHGVCVLCLILCTKRAKARAEIYHLLCMYDVCIVGNFFPLLRIHIIIPHIINRDLFWYYGFFRFGIFCRSHSDRRFFFVASKRETYEECKICVRRLIIHSFHIFKQPYTKHKKSIDMRLSFLFAIFDFFICELKLNHKMK